MELQNPNPNHDPHQNVISTKVSRQLHDNLHQYKQLQTKLTKVNHHIDFLKTCLEEVRIPFGLRWNTTVNVMEPNEEINQQIKLVQLKAEKELLKVIIDHYNTVRDNLETQRGTIENTIDNMKTQENSEIKRGLF